MPRHLFPLLTICLACNSGPSGEDDTGAGSSGTAASADDTAAEASDDTGDGPTSDADGTSGGSSDGGSADEGTDDSSSGEPPPLENFSFFVTSLVAMQELSGDPEGFGGDLRFGEEGPGAGLRGADEICATIAERSMPGAGSKPWRAFLSAVDDGDGIQVDAIDRIGEGPWYDRLGRLVAASTADIMTERPTGADPMIIDDLPNEDGVPNHRPDPTMPEVDNHDTLTGTNENGQLYGPTSTCNDWTGNTGTEGRPRVGHSWIREMGPGPGPGPGPGMGDGSMENWMSSLDESGCAPGVSLIEMGPPDPESDTVGSGGGYGGIYCFSLVP